MFSFFVFSVLPVIVILSPAEPFEFEIGDTKFNGRLANEDELKDFWLNHGSHFEYCLGVSQSNQNKGKKDKKPV